MGDLSWLRGMWRRGVPAMVSGLGTAVIAGSGESTGGTAVIKFGP